ncbi:MAG TPA: hypothetical protein VGU68_03920 [Ktedonobacteraceae bacterium]|nr:hypothetical protein [Ktedonobacteraceae bacterium]
MWSKNGVSSYLCTYLGKTTFPLELCGLMYRRRLWASTIPRGEEPEPIWTKEDLTGGDLAAEQAQTPHIWGVHNGFVLEMAKAGCYALWSRITEHVKDVSIIDEIELEETDGEWALRRHLDARYSHVGEVEFLDEMKKPP